MRFLNVLVCPVCKGSLEYRKDAQELVCKPCRLAYPIVDDIPLTMEAEARSLGEEEAGGGAA